MDMQFDFTGRRVLVTGGSRGIGFAVASQFAQAEAQVTILSEAADVGDAAARIGKGVAAIRCDVTDRAGLRHALAKLDRIDVLVSNAGTGDIAAIDGDDESDAIFDRIVAINLAGAWNVVRAALPRMQAGGRILFTSSVHGQSIAPPAMSAYAASKGGLEALLRSLARELGPRGINVNAVAPGMVATELTLGAVRKLFWAQLGRDGVLPPEDEMIRALNQGQAIHNLPVDPVRLAQAFLFLASDAGAAITGQSFNVDHGLMMK